MILLITSLGGGIMHSVDKMTSNPIGEDEIDLIELIRVLIKGKKIIFISIFLSLIFGLLSGMIIKSRNYQSRVLLNFNFQEILDGKNPDGTRFDINLITSTPVLNKVIEAESTLVEKGIGVEALKRAITLEPITPNHITKQIEENYKNGVDFTYFPSTYLIRFSLTKDLDYDRKILDRIIFEYKSYFEYRYNKLEIIGSSTGNYEKYDYVELLEIFENNLLRVKNLLLEEKNNKFRSSTLLITYSDLLGEIELLENIEFKNLKSIVENKNLSKDKWRVIEKYRNLIKELELQKAKYLAEEKIVKEMLDNYKPDNNQIILPSLEGTIVEGNNNSYYERLIEKATEAGVSAVFLEEDIKYYKTRIIELENQENINNEYIEEVGILIVSIEKKYKQVIENVNILNREYNQVYFSNLIRKISPIEIVNDVKIEIYLLISLALGLFFGVGMVFIIEFKKKHL